MIDINFNFQLELNKGKRFEDWKDADRYSKELQETHRILWSKPLPDGKMFSLEKIAGNRLRHKSELGEFVLSSDRAVPAFFYKTGWLKKYPYLSELPEGKVQSFWHLTETIGAMAIWPAKRKLDGMTINQERGCNYKIADRLDLTLECIRRYYAKMDSPLAKTFNRYNDFFSLFNNFKAYVDFFIFQDWVAEDYKTVKIAPPFDDFNLSPVPSTIDEYLVYHTFIMEMIQKRNERIDKLYNTVK